MLDLHCHTTYSDGTLTPTALVGRAIAAGVSVLAITDHDTMAGWDEAQAASIDQPIDIVPGLELSTSHNDRPVHILGFYPDRETLQAPLNDLIEGRWRRAERMVDTLASLGMVVQLPERTQDIAPGRPHLATALVEAGYAKTPQEAFERWLGEDKPAYVEYEQFSACEGIQLLRRCGGVPVWAHPYLFRGGPVEAVLPHFVAAGLMGLEVYHPNHTPRQSRLLEILCQKYGLLMTGGSDYHGPPANGKEDSSMGLNQMRVPQRLLGPLQEAARSLADRR